MDINLKAMGSHDNVHLCVSIWSDDSGSWVKTKVDWRKTVRKEIRGCWIYPGRKAEGMNFSYNLEIELGEFVHKLDVDETKS